jgi:preprotein translocase subunit SecG
MNCRRCGGKIGGENMRSNSPRGPRDAAKKSTWLYTILFIAVIIAAASYLFSGIEKSYNEVNVNELNRKASQPKPTSDGLGTRTEQDQKQAGQYKNAVANSPGLAESQKHFDETQKLMHPEQSKTRK